MVKHDRLDQAGRAIANAQHTLGVKEQLIFPEIEYDKIDKLRGLEVVIVTSAKSDDEGRELLRQFGMPFAKPGK